MASNKTTPNRKERTSLKKKHQNKISQRHNHEQQSDLEDEEAVFTGSCCYFSSSRPYGAFGLREGCIATFGCSCSLRYQCLQIILVDCVSEPHRGVQIVATFSNPQRLNKMIWSSVTFEQFVVLKGQLHDSGFRSAHQICADVLV